MKNDAQFADTKAATEMTERKPVEFAMDTLCQNLELLEITATNLFERLERYMQPDPKVKTEGNDRPQQSKHITELYYLSARIDAVCDKLQTIQENLEI